MKFAVLTRSVVPFHCGVGDYTVNFSKALRARGVDAEVLAGRGAPSEHIHIISDRWDKAGLACLLDRMEQTRIDHVILQFTPLAFRNGETCREALATFWNRCWSRWKTSLVVHETYFRAWWYPPSWIKGTREKTLLRRMVEQSHFVFTASQPLVDEMRYWGGQSRISHLPIGSNLPFVEAKRSEARSRLAINPDEIVLVLFGGGNSLKWMRNHVQSTDALLHSKGVKASWLLLGGIPNSWFRLRLPVVSPGRLSEEELSIRLQASDIFLMPHYAGLCAKRGTLMAAMQHRLPAVGTETPMTDAFWKDVRGITLLPRVDAKGFAQSVLELSRDGQKRLVMGQTNQDFFDHFCTWPTIADGFMNKVMQ